MTFRPRTRFGRALFTSFYLGLVGLLGCCGNHDSSNPKPEQDPRTEAFEVEIGDYVIEVGYHFDERRMTITDKTQKITSPNGRTTFSPYVYANDNGMDGRFDGIQLCGVPKGHALEEYVDLRTIQETFEKALLEHRRKKAQARADAIKIDAAHKWDQAQEKIQRETKPKSNSPGFVFPGR
jgi:hypothetical protein